MPRNHTPRTPAIFYGMTMRLTLLPVFALAALAPASASSLHPAGHLPVPLESFLNYHASSVRELSQEVTVDPVVRRRLARHFHITPAQMTTYIRQNLVLRRLQKSGTYRVACVRADGSEYYIESRLPAGTPVFASRATGQPILKLACGNPMVSALPPTRFPNKPVAPPRLAALPTTLTDSSLAGVPALTALDGTAPDLLTASDLSAPAVVQVSPSLQLLGGGGGSGLSSIFPALLGVGAAVGVFGNGNGGGNTGTPIGPVNPAVPESSTATSLGLLFVGGSLLFILRRKTRTV